MRIATPSASANRIRLSLRNGSAALNVDQCQAIPLMRTVLAMIRNLCLILQFATATVAASAAGQTLEPDKQRLSSSFEPVESWYPKECCPLDCTPLQNPGNLALESGNLPRAVVTAEHGKVPIPRHVPLQQSHDDRVHVCIGYDAFGDIRVKCLCAPLMM